MPAQADSIEKVRADMTAVMEKMRTNLAAVLERACQDADTIIQRAIGLGERLATERYMEMLRAGLETSEENLTPPGQDGLIPTAAASPPQTVLRRRDDPNYGTNAMMIRRAVRDSAASGGIFPSQIPQYCEQQYGASITAKQVHNSAKSLRRTNSIRSSKGKWFPGPGMDALPI